jgi:hypothetical protein
LWAWSNATLAAEVATTEFCEAAARKARFASWVPPNMRTTEPTSYF